MKLEQGATFGDLAGSLRGKFDDLPSSISEELDALQKLSGRNTREETVLDMFHYYGEHLRAIKENREEIYVNKSDIDELRMRGISLYTLPLPKTDY